MTKYYCEYDDEGIMNIKKLNDNKYIDAKLFDTVDDAIRGLGTYNGIILLPNGERIKVDIEIIVSFSPEGCTRQYKYSYEIYGKIININ